LAVQHQPARDAHSAPKLLVDLQPRPGRGHELLGVRLLLLVAAEPQLLALATEYHAHLALRLDVIIR